MQRGEIDLFILPKYLIDKNANFYVIPYPVQTFEIRFMARKDRKLNYQQWSDLKNYKGLHFSGPASTLAGSQQFEQFATEQRLDISNTANYED